MQLAKIIVFFDDKFLKIIMRNLHELNYPDLYTFASN